MGALPQERLTWRHHQSDVSENEDRVFGSIVVPAPVGPRVILLQVSDVDHQETSFGVIPDCVP